MYKFLNYKILAIISLLITADLLIPYIIQKPLFGIRTNRTDSLPYTMFFSTELKELKHEMYVAYTHPSSNIRISKQVMGLPGDQISSLNNEIYINNTPLGPIQPFTSNGSPLTPIQEGIIPEGYVFIYGPHPYSFDSRYAEIGLVAMAEIKEKLWPIF